MTSCYLERVSIITVPIAVQDPADLGGVIDAANAAVRAGADLIEWRLDAVVATEPAASVMATLVRDVDVGSLLTCRSVDEGGAFEGTDEDLAQWLGQMSELDPAPLWVDVEYARWRRSQSVRSAAASLAGVKVLMSFHDFSGRPADLLRIASDMQEAACDGVKLVWRARSIRDALECRDLLADRSKPMVALCMGPHGVMSRVMAGAWGGLMTFAAADADSATASGQPTLEQLQLQYRFHRLGPDSAIYGLIGDPLGDSLGYELHNQAFEAAGLNSVYLPLPTAAGWESLKATLCTLIDHASVHFRGASITLPHKSDLVRFVREQGGQMDELAQVCEAANTLSVGADGGLRADNTDALGIIEPLLARGARLEGGRAAVLGAGGVARAAAAILLQHGSSVDLYNRNVERANQVASDLGDLGSISVCQSVNAGCDTVVQATSVGMTHGPAPNDDIMQVLGLDAEALFQSNTVTLETIYDPIETPFLQSARAAGCEVATGRDMWRAQAEAQQHLWTGVAARF